MENKVKDRQEEVSIWEPIEKYLEKHPFLRKLTETFDTGALILGQGEYCAAFISNNNFEDLSENDDRVQTLREMKPRERLDLKARLREYYDEMYRAGARMEAALIRGTIAAIEHDDYQFPLIARYERFIV